MIQKIDFAESRMNVQSSCNTVISSDMRKCFGNASTVLLATRKEHCFSDTIEQNIAVKLELNPCLACIRNVCVHWNILMHYRHIYLALSAASNIFANKILVFALRISGAFLLWSRILCSSAHCTPESKSQS